MYSVVLATMLTATSTTPAWGFGHGCHGCWSCYGCHGCWSSCYGCHGCWSYGCHGCWSSCYGCHGCWSSCYGCYGCYGCCGGVVIQPVYVAPPAKKEEKRSDASAQAKVIIQVPEDATLYIDGQRAPLTSATRTFLTPALEPQRKYYYDLKVETVRDGKVIEESKRVVVQAGAVARVDFSEPTPAVESATARITVRLPEEAKLFVDGQRVPLTSNTRVFDTPKLEAGRKFFYNLKAEVVRDGQTLSQSQRIVVQAGKKVDVRFDSLAPAATSTAAK